MKKPEVKGYIEQIGGGHNERVFMGRSVLKRSPDTLYISNKPDRWILNLFNGYKQLGTFRVDRPHVFRERDKVIVRLEDNKIVNVWK